MKKTLLVFCATFLVGCATSSPMQSAMTCPGPNKKDLKISYGDGYIEVDYRTTAKKVTDQKIVIQLHATQSKEPPKGSGTNFETLPIIVRGKTQNDRTVIDMQVSASDPVERRTICLENAKPGTYRFEVHVPGVGTIDPIIDIIPENRF